MSRVFAIGDLHGCSRTFRNLIKKISLEKDDTLYCLGDYVDRGPDCKGVIDYILELRSAGFSVFTLRGNHEQIMMDSVKGDSNFYHWTDNGGTETLQSFGVESYVEFPMEYREFFESTEFYRTNGRHIFAHAGLNTKIPDPFTDTVSMLWIRGFTVDTQWLGNRVLVHGHTPMLLDVIKAQLDEPVIDIDGGCVYRNRDGLGYLVALNVTANKLVVERNDEGVKR